MPSAPSPLPDWYRCRRLDSGPPGSDARTRPHGPKSGSRAVMASHLAGKTPVSTAPPRFPDPCRRRLWQLARWRSQWGPARFRENSCLGDHVPLRKGLIPIQYLDPEPIRWKWRPVPEGNAPNHLGNRGPVGVKLHLEAIHWGARYVSGRLPGFLMGRIGQIGRDGVPIETVA